MLATSFRPSSSTITLPFQLKRLDLRNKPVSHTLLQALLTPSLQTLTISLLPSSPTYASLIALFPLVGPTLYHLHLLHRASPALLQTLDHCVALQTFVAHPSVDLEGAVPRLARVAFELRTVEVHVAYNTTLVVGLLELLVGRDGGQMRSVCIRGASVEGLEKAGVGDFVQRCAKAGVQLRLDKVL